MHHVIVIRNSCDQRVQFLKFIFRQIVLQVFRPVDGNGFHIRHVIRSDNRFMDLLQKVDRHSDNLVNTGRVLDNQFDEGFRIQQFEYRTVSFADANDIVRYRCRNTHNKSLARKVALALDILQTVRIHIVFNYGVAVYTVHLTVSSLTDNLASFY